MPSPSKHLFIIPIVLFFVVLFGVGCDSPFDNNGQNQKVSTNGASQPTNQNISSIYPETDTGKENMDYRLQQGPIFDRDKIVFALPVVKDKKIYYLKEGDIWKEDVSDLSRNIEKILDIDEPILLFDISRDQNLVTYSIQNYPADDEFTFQYGDTIFLYDVKSNFRSLLYSNESQTDMQIRSMGLSNDSGQLFFTNNSLWVVNVQSHEAQKFLTEEKNTTCSIFFIKDVSPDDLYLLLQRYCLEPSSQLIFSLKEKKVEQTIANFDITELHGFMTNDLLFGRVDSEVGDSWISNFGVYNRDGSLRQHILETSYNLPHLFDNISNPDTIFVSMPSNATIKDQRIYKIDNNSFQITNDIPKINLMVILNDDTLWATNSSFKDPVFIDQSVEWGNLFHKQNVISR